MWKRTAPALMLALALATPPALDAATLPRPALDLYVNLPDGRELPLSTHKGKVIIMAFILTACSHCQVYTRLLTKMQTEFGGRGLQVIMSSVDTNPKPLVPGFIRAYQPPFPVGYNEFSLAADFLDHSRTQTLPLPAVAFIDRQGIIVAQHQAGEPFIEINAEQNLRSMVQSVLSGEASRKALEKISPKKAPSVPKKK